MHNHTDDAIPKEKSQVDLTFTRPEPHIVQYWEHDKRKWTTKEHRAEMLSKAINPADARLKPLTLQEIHHHNLGQSVPQPTHDLETKLPLSTKQV
jgi:hypothetical protein